jgi:hypothetical protein
MLRRESADGGGRAIHRQELQFSGNNVPLKIGKQPGAEDRRITYKNGALSVSVDCERSGCPSTVKAVALVVRGQIAVWFVTDVMKHSECHRRSGNS